MKAMVFTGVLTIVSLLVGYGAFAQESKTQRRGQQDRDPQPAESARTSGIDEGHIDRELANCLAIDNWAEIEIARFALGKAQSQDVKQFAEMLQKDHTEFVNRLRELQPNLITLRVGDSRTGEAATSAQPENRRNANSEERRDSTAPGASRDTARQTVADAHSTGHGTARDAKFLQIKQEIARACVDTLQREFSAKPSGEFDRCFLGAQVLGHLRMVDTLKVFERHASTELSSAIANASEKAQKHLDQAKQLLARYETKLTAREPNRPGVVK